MRPRYGHAGALGDGQWRAVAAALLTAKVHLLDAAPESDAARALEAKLSARGGANAQTALTPYSQDS